MADEMKKAARWTRAVATNSLLVALAACGGGQSNQPPVGQPANYSTSEENAVSGTFVASDPEGKQLSFMVASGAQHGQVTVNASSGEFVYEPAIDFYGSDRFAFVANDGRTTSAPATVTITVDNLPDPPRIEAIPELRNSADAAVVEYVVRVMDPDPDRPELSAEATDPSVVSVAIDQSTGTLSLRALRVGRSNVTVRAADADFTALTSFQFSADEVTRRVGLRFESPESSAIVLTNTADREIDFVLTHNGFPVFEDLAAVVAFVADLEAEFPGEGFDRKLWRFLRDSVYHEVPLDSRQWLHDPWVTLNSLGWGFCSHVSGTFVEIARAAGYDARVWGLDGHVVGEIFVDGKWRMYDSDLAVYYKAGDGSIAEVGQLATDAALITSPVQPIFAGSWYQFPYTQLVADIYSSMGDNFDGDAIFIANEATPSGRIVLPRAASLTYPGKWTAAPIGYDGIVPYQVRQFRQALLELPDGWTGTVNLPWMLWEIMGSGQVAIGGEPFDVGTTRLSERIQQSGGPIVTLDVLGGSSIKLVFLINAVMFDLKSETELDLTGLDVWAVRGDTVTLPEENAAAMPLSVALRKPLPTLTAP